MADKGPIQMVLPPFAASLAGGVSRQMYRELRVRGKLVHPWPLDGLWCFAVKDEMPALHTAAVAAAPDGIHM